MVRVYIDNKLSTTYYSNLYFRLAKGLQRQEINEIPRTNIENTKECSKSRSKVVAPYNLLKYVPTKQQLILLVTHDLWTFLLFKVFYLTFDSCWLVDMVWPSIIILVILWLDLFVDIIVRRFDLCRYASISLFRLISRCFDVTYLKCLIDYPITCWMLITNDKKMLMQK